MTGMNDEENKNTEVTPQAESPGHTKQVWLGIGLLAVLHLLLFLFPFAFFFISIAQLVYLIPAILVFHKKSGIVQGLLIGAGITFLLNAACFGLLASGLFRLSL
ncbi:hypothetical protein SAMN02799624_06167 [Paenibacillus sp. UNC496MF]|uniref:hypothetical protein n=1 Tax=Paenibacillus sp. UNC496MF TaxID=1502753 RepID=UPI0008F07121|nr:hypothetical protein [Paenibacillus sp. UNC496MF]SFJ83011.1 hypothetical protein SAMN02799624_06167 [Paenibacillus sp. UNC496MF]